MQACRCTRLEANAPRLFNKSERRCHRDRSSEDALRMRLVGVGLNEAAIASNHTIES